MKPGSTSYNSGLRKNLADKLFQPVPIGSLATFRFFWGLLLCCHCVDFLYDGTVTTFYVEPPFTFTFIGFEFLEIFKGPIMYYVFGLMALLAVCIMLGAWYRIAMTSFALLWTMVYLMQKSNYNNHYYLIVLLCWIMVLLPAHRYASLDVRRNPSLKSNQTEQWVYWLFIAQMAILYFFAATSKFNHNWLSGNFIAIRFSRLAQHPLLGFIYGNTSFQMLITYGGLVFDLLIVPLLLWKKTRTPAIWLAIIFHLFNSYTFKIGIFPYLSIALLVFFIDPRALSKRIFARFDIEPAFNQSVHTARHKWIIVALGAYLALQLWLPLRHLFYPGNVFWTEEGYKMSWKMMLRTKSGTVHFKVRDPQTKEEWIVDPAKQFKPVHIMWLAGSPDIIWQYAQRIKKEYLTTQQKNVEVYAIGKISLNRTAPRPLVDSTVNLADIDWQPFSHAQWIMEYK